MIVRSWLVVLLLWSFGSMLLRRTTRRVPCTHHDNDGIDGIAGWLLS
jgi:hypothetical protein